MSKLTHAFIQNSNNGHYIAAWNNDNRSTHPVTHDDAQTDAENISPNKFLFINP